ncbi:MAG: class I tRNA ligase family protein, partial [Thiomicrorhabdus sp.]|nr:class I tRNA ligase family protein [Thiomicrorhabdus sp.]
RLLHPIIPFITEEAWQSVAPLAGKQGETIMLAPYPQADESKIDLDAMAELEWVKNFIVGVRKIRSEMDIAPGKPLPVFLDGLSTQDQQWLDNNKRYLLSLAKLATIDVLDPNDIAPESAVALVGEMKVLIPIAGLIDKDAELARLSKEIGKLQNEIKRLSGKLSNQGFVAKAPEAVVAKEREKLAGYQAALHNLETQYEKIQQI